jgi:hypothetical protein
MPYVRKAMGAFRQIIQNPIGFVRNLVRAGIQGFRQFGANFLSHLRNSLIQWLTGTLGGTGIYIPQAFELREIVKFVLSVLGLTWQNIRTRLLRIIPEPVLHALETGLDIVVTLVREGPAAAWEKIREQLSNLRELVMEQIMSFVQSRIVQAAITRLVTSLNPAGAFIQAIIAIYNTVMFFVERLRQIGQVAAAFIDSISAIAAGSIGTAANRVEQTMAGLLTLVISFLARLVGLGRVSDVVKNIVDRIRAPINVALDRVADWIGARAGAFMQRAAGGTPEQRLSRGMAAAQSAANRFAGRRVGAAVLRPLLAAIRLRYQMASLEIVPERGRWTVVGRVNPDARTPTTAMTPEEFAPGAGQTTLLLGEGDFSFALSLARLVGPVQRAGIVATEIRGEPAVAAAYPAVAGRTPGGVANLASLRALGVRIQTGVDATNIVTTFGRAHTIALTFPFIEGPRDNTYIQRNVGLITGFLESAADAIEPGGRILLTTSAHWHRQWRSDQRAPASLYVAERRQFDRRLFPGYEHRQTGQNRSAKVEVAVTLVYRQRMSERGQ